MLKEEVIALLVFNLAGDRSKADGWQNRVPEEAVGTAVDHVLHHQDAVSVAIVVEGFCFDLDVLAKTIEAHCLD